MNGDVQYVGMVVENFLDVLVVMYVGVEDGDVFEFVLQCLCCNCGVVQVVEVVGCFVVCVVVGWVVQCVGCVFVMEDGLCVGCCVLC